ncbi:D-hexose-6-phosphate mutarotase [Thiomicrorhabdus sediminis]|uniref:Putative glucose-6-phosphate 1-epimerase n=1 Tax=Thiomicrorhabdus sediminis TaxID=2580412 RepID=A0A4P9K9A0_9GAMM|nr:D-hexose-6-phosphate mutarotase [Thiomicrorhabdus sediminis]QCU91016.1 D-hexose-6-phosphate mutarotase [Thiomicrorhabdus sediminis]
MSQIYSQLKEIEGVALNQEHGIEIIEIDNDFAKAVITTHGASVLSYAPHGQHELLWVSGEAVFDGSKPVRGGIPVCWPWFGQARDSSLPAHGFVRNMTWQLETVQTLDTGETRISLVCHSSEETLAIWPHKFSLMLTIEIGPTLILTLTTHNLSDQTLSITEAFHTYFNLAPEGLEIRGIEGSTHLNKLVEDSSAELQARPLVLTPPRDSVFLNQTGNVFLVDNDNKRQIKIAKRNASSSVVWNPGADIVKGFADIHNDAWTQFVCVESGNVLDNFITVLPNEQHVLSVQYSMLELA